MFLTRIHLEVFWTWYNTNDYNTCRTKRNNIKMPNKGLRKMQAKPLLNITKTI
jgi:hypothetical protein